MMGLFALVCRCSMGWASGVIVEQGLPTPESAAFHCPTVLVAIADWTCCSVSVRWATRFALVQNLGSSTIDVRPETAQNLRQRLSLATPIMIGPSAASNAW